MSFDLDSFVAEYGSYFVEAIEYFIDDPEDFCTRLPKSKNVMLSVGQLSKKDNGDFFTTVEPVQLSHFIMERNGLDFFPYPLAMFALERMEKSIGIPKVLQGSHGTYGLFSNLLKHPYENGWLKSAILGYRFFCNHFRDGIFEVTIKTDKGDICTGSGFVTTFDNGKNYIVTCKHNLFSESGIAFDLQRIASENFEIATGVRLKMHRIDAVFLEVSGNYDGPVLRFAAPKLLEKVISAGYPRIHHFESSPLLFHRGEVNGWTGKIEDGTRALVNSCDVAPGNSGGPLFNDNGVVVGMVFRKTETSSTAGMANYSLAIPMESLKYELENENFETLSQG